MPSIPDNIARVRERIAEAALGSGRDPGEVVLVAVTKTVPAERVREAVAVGVDDLGESYFQEARDKMAAVGGTVRWHFVGHLQSNKARGVVGRFSLVHGIDSIHLAREVGRRAAAANLEQPVLLEVRLDPAGSKWGVDPGAVGAVAAEVASTPGLRLDGLMGMPPPARIPDDSRPAFALLRGLFEALPAANRRVLSMGMSADYEAAIREGATHVRVGTAIFGARQP